MVLIHEAVEKITMWWWFVMPGSDVLGVERRSVWIQDPKSEKKRYQEHPWFTPSITDLLSFLKRSLTS